MGDYRMKHQYEIERTSFSILVCRIYNTYYATSHPMKYPLCLKPTDEERGLWKRHL